MISRREIHVFGPTVFLHWQPASAVDMVVTFIGSPIAWSYVRRVLFTGSGRD